MDPRSSSQRDSTVSSLIPFLGLHSIEYHNLGAQQKSSTYNSGGSKSEISILAGLVHPEGYVGRTSGPTPCLVDVFLRDAFVLCVPASKCSFFIRCPVL